MFRKTNFQGSKRSFGDRFGGFFGVAIVSLFSNGAMLAEANAQEGEGTLALPAVKVEADSEAEQSDSRGYLRKHAGSALKTDTPIMQTPSAIQLVPQSVIEDQQAFELSEVLRNVSGMTFVDGGEGVNIFSRGFSASIYKDGFSRTEFTDGDIPVTDLDTLDIERVEVLKGPSSVLYGRGNPGGAVNLVTKKPLDEQKATFGYTTGSWGLHRPTVDLSTPITEELGFRVNGLLQTRNSYRDLVESERAILAPVLEWNPGEGTRLELKAEYADFERTPDVGLPRDGNDLVEGLSRNRFLGEEDDFQQDITKSTHLIVEQEVAPNWELRSRLYYSDNEMDTIFTRGGGLQDDGRTLNRTIIDSRFDFEDYRAELQVEGEVETGGLTHEVLVGLEYAHRTTDVLFSGTPTNPIDIFEPIYGNGGPIDDPNFVFLSESERDLVGLFLQDRIVLSENWSFLAGVRYDYLDQEIVAGLIGNTEPAPSKTDSAISPRAGLVYSPMDELAFFAQFSRSFQPQNGTPTDFDGNILEAEKANLYELGVKTELFDGRFRTTATLYQIDREDIGTADLENEGFQLAIGEQRSQGFELDMVGELAPGWRLIAAYAYTDAEIRGDAELASGNELQGIPEHSGSIWSTYEFQSGDLKGLGFGAGVRYVGERQGDNANTFQVPDYTQLDATVFYKRGPATVRLSGYNLSDEDILLNPTRSAFYAIGTPASVLASLSLSY